jgi:sugar/nucleoside kinase (ribokinase family)
MKTNGVNYEEIRASVIKKIERSEVRMDLVTMPDFFLDHSLTYKQGASHLAKRISSVATKGGGEIPDIPQRLEVGGNAAICTMALARLGAMVHPIMKTNQLGRLLLEYFYKDFRVDLSHIKTYGNLAPTVILELGSGKKLANVMVGDSAAVSDLNFDDFIPADLSLLSNANCVCVFNWLYNRKGTELAEGVFRYCRQNSKARAFFDPADPWPRRAELPELARRIIRSDLLDFLGVNENEAILIARIFHKKIRKGRGNMASALEASKVIAESTNIKVFVHTARYSASIARNHCAIAPTFKVSVRRGTGAGDSWNAGILVAESLGLGEEEKLLFANTVAARYISQQDREYASIEDITNFLKDPHHSLNILAT